MAQKRAPGEIVEEYDSNDATGVEEEDSDGGGPSPYDPAKIRVDPKTFSLRQIIDMIDDGDLNLAPDFQRKKVWRAREKSRLIESVLLRIPLPAFYFSADTDGRLRVVDGLQRLSTIHDFVKGGPDGKGGFALENLEYLRDGVAAKRYFQLDATWTRRIHQTQIFVNVIDPQTPTQVKFDIFKRLNTGGTPLNGQEIRHCMSGARSRDFLKACTGGFEIDSPTGRTAMAFSVYQDRGGGLPAAVYQKATAAASEFHAATNSAMRDHVRMADREIVLRFVAFRLLGDDLESGYGPKTAMDDFLTDATDKLDGGVKDSQLTSVAADLGCAMRNANAIFGLHAFRKWPTDSEDVNPINRALFESWAVALADYDLDVLVARKSKIVSAARKAMTADTTYLDAITAGTGDHGRVKVRFEVARKILEKAIR